MKKLIRRLFASAPNRYFRFGMRYLAKVPSAFAREIALEQAMNFVKQCKVPGDYLEFGVWQGRTFSAACYLARERGLDMQFWAFDSFEGLPSNEGEFQTGTYKCGQEAFLKNVRKCIGDVSRVHVVPGWFSDTLGNGNPQLSHLGPVAVAWVDCDLYESTKPVLEFLTHRLQDGSLIFFDDWYCVKGRSDCGEQRACREWLERNPAIKLMEYAKIAWHGQAFIVHLDKPE
jgi:O-methyltransferase